MHIFSNTVAAIALVTGLIGSAHADQAFVERHGVWSNYAYPKADNNNLPLCAAIDTWNAQFLSFKFDGQAFFMQVGKDSWNIPEGKMVTVNFQVDNAPPFTMNFVSMKNSTGGTLLSFTFNPDAVDDNTGALYLDEVWNVVRNGLQLHLGFPDGTEPNWSASLVGSTAALDSLKVCGQIINKATQPTQPTKM